MGRQRRLYLSVTLKLMTLSSVVMAVYILITSLGVEEKPITYKTVTLTTAELDTGRPEIADWEGKPILLLVRDKVMLESLTASGAELVDPESTRSVQPTGAQNPHRSLRPELFVVLARGTLMGCPLEYVDVGSSKVPFSNWKGGFREQCSDAWYDLAGRAYHHGRNSRNLMIPPHHFDRDGRLVIGSNNY